MGLGSFFSHLVAPVTKALGPTGTAVFLPSITVTQIASKAIDKAVGGLSGTLQQRAAQQRIGQGGQHQIPVAPRGGVPYGQAPFQPYQPYIGGGGGFAPSYDFTPIGPQQTFQGGSPWDFSTASWTYSTPQYQASYPVQSERSWEDLALQVAPFFL